jgi:hypothetical protein
MGEESRADLLKRLVNESFAFDATAPDPERNCWLAVHRYAHGVLPSEYDIREIDEELYLAVLELRRRSEEPGRGSITGS